MGLRRQQTKGLCCWRVAQRTSFTVQAVKQEYMGTMQQGKYVSDGGGWKVE